ncbi:hypothetical protein EVAR_81128_1 [Eumeta japonica]|uniref:Uncharacterized protein n=1 Tax=Eumeta variegata TaxID=151549 RepID=A0A4C1YRI7_EUMVA|nr:hypothetical protein EVAR_81128_1 [Eumeta japonica]
MTDLLFRIINVLKPHRSPSRPTYTYAISTLRTPPNKQSRTTVKATLLFATPTFKRNSINIAVQSKNIDNNKGQLTQWWGWPASAAARRPRRRPRSIRYHFN